MSDRAKVGAGVLAVVIVVVLFVVLSGGDDGDSKQGGGTTTAAAGKGGSKGGGAASIPVIRLRGGDPIGGPPELEVTSGDDVRFKVTSDIDGEVHVHGYDVERPIKAGGSVSFDFPADLEGGFEIEFHHGGGENAIAGLKVGPG